MLIQESALAALCIYFVFSHTRGALYLIRQLSLASSSHGVHTPRISQCRNTSPNRTLKPYCFSIHSLQEATLAAFHWGGVVDMNLDSLSQPALPSPALHGLSCKASASRLGFFSLWPSIPPSEHLFCPCWALAPVRQNLQLAKSPDPPSTED